MLIGIDMGGTFTDIVAVHGAELVILKVPSQREPEEGVRTSLKGLEERVGAGRPERLVHGTTVATNALLEGRWAPVTTEGFRDVLEIARQDRPKLYDLKVERPSPIVPRDLRFEVPERMDYCGGPAERPRRGGGGDERQPGADGL